MSNTQLAENETNETTPAANAAVPEFLQTLRDEHRYFQSLLDIAREQSKFLEDGTDVDLDILQELLQYLAEYPEDYHHPREDLMFDRLRAADPASGRIIDRLQVGHDEVHRESNRLHFSVMRANNGEDIRRGKLAADILTFVQGYEKHMDDEDNVIFLRALNALSEKDWTDLYAEMDYVEDPLFGTRVRRRYRRLANVLEARLGVAKRELVMAEFLSLGAIIDNMVTIGEATVNLTYILRDRSGEAWRDNLKAARDDLGSGEFMKIVKLPWRLQKNTWDSVRRGARESRNLVARTIEDVRTPYNMRVDTLKEILREDWRR